MWTEGRRDITKLVAAFRNFGNAPTAVAFIGFDCVVQL